MFNTHCIELQKSIYGNKDAAILFFRELTAYLRDPIGLEPCDADPCIFYRKDGAGNLVLLLLTYVDDTIILGEPMEVQRAIDLLDARFGWTDQGAFTRHLNLEYEWHLNGDDKFVDVRMPALVDDILGRYETAMGAPPHIRHTPGTPNLVLQEWDGETLHGEAYRCIVGKLTYLTSKVFVEASNVSRSLSRYFHNPGPNHWKELEHVLGYMRGNTDAVRLRIRTPHTLAPAAMVDPAAMNSVEDWS